MIVKNEETLKDALEILKTSPKGIRYSDQYAYIIIITPETLAYQCRRALARDDIAVVGLVGDEHKMEDYGKAFHKTRLERTRVKALRAKRLKNLVST